MGEPYSDIRLEEPAAQTGETVESLRRQVRVLSCLYGLTRLAVEEHDQSAENLLNKSLDLIQASLDHPESDKVAITFREHGFGSVISAETRICCRAPIVLLGTIEGEVMVIRREDRECSSDRIGEELINAAASHLSLILERVFAIVEREELQQQLRHADRLATIGQLAAGVAHQLNDPLGNILGFAELAKKVHSLPRQAADDLDRIIDASLNAREVIRKLMLFARQMPPERTRFFFDKIVQDSLQFFDSLCARQGIELVRDLHNADRTVLADETQLRQVLINLVVNAIQAMEDGGTLTVRTWDEEKGVFLEVVDTGVGIAKELQEQIFVPFFTTKDVDEGTGLGLAIVHGIVRTHGGEIIVRSAPGKGSSFQVRLPAAPSQGVEG
ncbi:MAG: ATP-binding protein [bacterium]